MIRTLLATLLLVAAGSHAAGAADPAKDVADCSDLIDLEEYQRAVDICTRAIESPNISPKLLERAHFHRGIAYRNLGRAEDAIEEYEIVIETAPDDAFVYMNRANAYYDLGDYRRAIDDYDRAIALADGDYRLNVIYENRGQSYAELGDYDRALADYDQSIRLDPYYAIAYNDRGVTYREIGDEDKALSDYSKAIELDPNYALPYRNRGGILAGRGDHASAIRDYSHALDIRPDDSFAYFGRGSTHYLARAYADAATDLEKALELDPEFSYAALWLYLAVAHDTDTGTARTRFSRISERLDLGAWPGPLIRYYEGDIGAETASAAATNSEERCEADFYVGALDALRNARATAVERLRRAVQTCPRNFVELDGARVELTRLGE